MSIGQEIDLWGELRHVMDGLRADMLVTEAACISLILTLVTSLANAHIQSETLTGHMKCPDGL